MAASSERVSLAIFGNKPAFAEPLHVGRPNLPDKQAILERIAGVLDRNWLTNGGPLVAEFERRVAVEAGVKHCIAVANGTIALELAVRVLGTHGRSNRPRFHLHRLGPRARVARRHARLLRCRPRHSYD